MSSPEENTYLAYDQLKDHCLRESDPISKALKIIDKSDQKIALVVNESNRLLGTITDGDIRRQSLVRMPLDTPVQQIMNSKPKTLKTPELGADHYDRLVANHLLFEFPVLNTQQQVTGMLCFSRKVSTKATTVVIMAGGKGTRLAPLTRNTPKPMLEVAGEPIIEGTIKRLKKQGFVNFLISVNYLAETIKDYLGDGSKYGVSINYLEETKPLGTAGCLWMAKDRIESTFLLMNGDVITNIDFANLLISHENQGSQVTMAVRNYQISIPYGVVEMPEANRESHQITGISEKPNYSFFVNAGIYALSPEIFEHSDDDSYLDMTTLCERIWQQSGTVSSFPIREYWIDIGEISELKRAEAEYDTIFSDPNSHAPNLTGTFS